MSSITATTVFPVFDGSGAPTIQVATAGDPQYVTRGGTNRVRIRAACTFTGTDATSANPGYAGIYLTRYTLDGHYIDDEWILSGHRSSAGVISVDEFIDTIGEANERWVVEIVMAKRFTGGTGYNWPLGGALKASFTTSLLTDQTPNPVVLTAPSTGITMLTGDSLNLTWDWSDPDDGTSGSNPDQQDYYGWQIQVRPGPSVADPDPAWINPTLHSNLIGEGGADRPSWMYQDSDPFVTWDADNAFALTLLAASSGVDTIDNTVRTLRLSSGTWQLRVRGVDGVGSYYVDASIPYFGSPDIIAAASPSSVSPWSDSITVYVVGSTLPPVLVSPGYEEGVYGDVDFSWMFQSPIVGATQYEWAIWAREVGDPTYTQIAGSGTGDDSSTYTWVNGSSFGGIPFTMVPGHQYEWIAYTEDTLFNISDASQPLRFWYTETPESGPELPLPEVTIPDPGLGCGHNRAFLYLRGGKVPLGEITGITKIVWGRIRDDISSCDITVQEWDSDCGALLAGIRSWQHEIVVFRDNGSGLKRVWEGPITRPSYEVDTVSIEAKDVMGYVYRRILRQGYNDAYRITGRTFDSHGHIVNPGVAHGLTTVTNRSRKIIQNALAYDDPNVLAYLWVLNRADDAKQSRVVPDWSRSAWQDIDDMAAKSGLDYTTVGRRIMLWDTHNPIGTLPEMRDGDFDKPPIVTEYGMQLANVYGVTNNNGIYGFAERHPGEFYGYVEMLVSAWGESDDNGQPDTLTAEAAAALRETLNGQADRGISQRWPTPVVVRVPDNSTLSPDLSIGINQLIPGVYIPLLSNKTLRKVRQTQKLDAMTVTEDENGETIQVTMSPAPTSHDYDPDEDPFGDDG